MRAAQGKRRGPSMAAIAIVLALVAVALVMAAMVFWSTTHTNSISFDRQRQLVSLVLDQRAARLAQDQETVTIGDGAVRRLRESPRDYDWLDINYGPYLHQFYGHDESYMLDPLDAPFYAVREGRRVSSDQFQSIEPAVRSLVAELRAKMRALGRVRGGFDGHSPNVFDVGVVNGHPAILSIKPVLPHTGWVDQVPGEEFVHISVRRLDGSFLNDLSRNYLFNGARFSWVDDSGPHEETRPFVSRRNNRVVGYFIWQPFAPGSTVLNDLGPALLLTLLFVAVVVSVLLRRIRRSTLELLASEAQAKHLAFHDVLTGLPNRALFEHRLERALALARRDPRHKVALLCLDVDRFKQVNDTLGHPAGDELIRTLAKRLSAVVRDSDTVARLGGDEFAIIQNGIRSEVDVRRLCEGIIETAGEAFNLLGSQIFVGMSVGVARSMDSLDKSELTRKADIALYNAKDSGRGRYAIFTDAMDEMVQLRRTIEQDLRVALDEGNQLEVYYQPLYDAATKQMTGVEALVRWNHPMRGLLHAETFISAAEESRLVEPLGDWVLKEVCIDAANWRLGTISVNVAAAQLSNALFAQRVLKILRTAGMNPARLQLEINESCFLEGAGYCEKNLKTLRAAGVRVAVDDFGTGYSSFIHLRKFEVDRLKIDPSFVAGISQEASSDGIIRAIVDLARSNGLKITAEGVETMEQSQFLSLVGCDELQGFLMSNPVTRTEIDELLGSYPQGREDNLPTAA